jgi:hypothetical protein
MLKPKKILLVMVLVFALATTASANPFAQIHYLANVVFGTDLAPYVEASFYIHAAAAVAGFFYYQKQGQASKVKPDGTIQKPAGATWIDLKDPPSVKNVDIKANLSTEKAAEIALKKPTIYPGLSDAARRNMPPTLVTFQAGGDYSNITGQNIVMTDGTGYRKLGAFEGLTRNNVNVYFGYSPPDVITTAIVGGSVYITLRTATWQEIGGVSGYYGSDRQWKYADAGVAPTSVRNTTKNEMTRVLTNQPVNDTPLEAETDVAANYQAELDAMLKDDDYVPTFSDATTGLPYAPPPISEIATPKQVDAYNKAGIAADASAASKSARDAAVSAAQAAADAANALAAANPGNTTYIAAANAANTELAKAQAAQASGDAADAQKDSDETTADVPQGEPSEQLDMAPLHALKGALDSTYPFNLPSVIAGYYDKFVSTPETPVFDLPLPLGQNLHVDLSVMEPIAILFRYLIGIVTTAGALAYVVHFFRGIS